MKVVDGWMPTKQQTRLRQADSGHGHVRVCSSAYTYTWTVRTDHVYHGIAVLSMAGPGG